MIIYSILTALWTVAAPPGGPCEVDSAHDGNGVFTYTFRQNVIPYVFGLSLGNGDITLRAPGVVDVTTPPNWKHSISNDFVVWSVTNGVIFLEEPVTFTIRSCVVDVVTNAFGTPMGGLIIGPVYDLPDHTLVSGGYQSFSFAAPGPPMLTIEHGLGEISVHWRSVTNGWSLEAATEVTGPWSTVSEPVTSNTTNHSVTFGRGENRRFFRLRMPCLRP